MSHPRYSSLLNSVVSLTSALEDARALLLIGAGARGIAPLRAAMEWPPVQVTIHPGVDAVLNVAPPCSGRLCRVLEWSFAHLGNTAVARAPVVHGRRL